MVAVLGYGIEGQAVTRYLMKHGIKPVLFDQKPWEEWSPAEQKKIIGLEINFIFGPDTFKELAGFDVAFRSPGVKLSDLDATQGPRSGSLLVTSQTKWFFEHCPAKIIGVTGTKGKGTTASLIYEILKRQESRTYLTGNIGKDQPFDFLDILTENDWVVYELSSFQLQDLTVSPHIAVVLMITEEHLDYHQSLQEYLAAKAAIVKFQNKNDFAIINADFASSKNIGRLGEGTKVFFSRKSELSAGCFIKEGEMVVKDVLRSNLKSPISNLQLKGEHNLENICAALCAAVCAGAKPAAIKKGIKNFKGLGHRLQLVAKKRGVEFYDDSFSTTPETAIAAILSFTQPEVVILGGSSKNSNFAQLAETINSKENIKTLILIGEEASKIKNAIIKTPGWENRILEGAKNMKEVFEQIKTVAREGDIVLLSPACASFGMFKNYKDRGEQFKKFALKF